MKIDIISDCHADFYIREQNPQNPKFIKQVIEYCNFVEFGTSKAEVIIIAGDISNTNTITMGLLEELKNRYKHIILVKGNHDLYLDSKTQQSKYMFESENRINEIKVFCRNNNINYLDGDIVEIDGYSFGGVGMSWDKSYYNKIVEYEAPDYEVIDLFNRTMNDSKYICSKGIMNVNIPTAYGGGYRQSGFNPFEYLFKEHRKLSRIKNVDVVVTHYGPIVPDNIPEKYKDVTTTFYYFDGEYEVRRINPKYWIFGHTHDTYDFMYKNTNIICNPMGYPGENKEFKIKTIILEKELE